MNKFYLFLYRFSPNIFLKVIEKNSKISNNISEYLFGLISKKNLHLILPHIDPDLFKALNLSVNRFSYLLFAYNFSDNDVKNKILIKMCKHIYDFECITPQEQIKSLFVSENNWFYSLIEESVSGSLSSEAALSLLDFELSLENSYLNEELVAISQLASLVDRYKHKINYVSFLSVFLKEISAN